MGLPQLGPLELGLILLIVVLVFGAGKLPELGGALGKTLKEFKAATREIDEVKQDVKESISIDSAAKKDTVARADGSEKKVAS